VELDFGSGGLIGIAEKQVSTGNTEVFEAGLSKHRH